MKTPKILNVIVYVLILLLAFGTIWMIFGVTDDLAYSEVMELLEKNIAVLARPEAATDIVKEVYRAI